MEDLEKKINIEEQEEERQPIIWPAIKLAFFIILIGVVGIVSVLLLLGYQFLVVAGWSMQPTIDINNLILVNTKVAIQDIKVNDILTYNMASIKNTHRILDIIRDANGEVVCFITQGDNPYFKDEQRHVFIEISDETYTADVNTIEIHPDSKTDSNRGFYILGTQCERVTPDKVIGVVAVINGNVVQITHFGNIVQFVQNNFSILLGILVVIFILVTFVFPKKEYVEEDTDEENEEDINKQDEEGNNKFNVNITINNQTNENNKEDEDK